jgi:hypothetical protein
MRPLMEELTTGWPAIILSGLLTAWVITMVNLITGG